MISNNSNEKQRLKDFKIVLSSDKQHSGKSDSGRDDYKNNENFKRKRSGKSNRHTSDCRRSSRRSIKDVSPESKSDDSSSARSPSPERHTKKSRQSSSLYGDRQSHDKDDSSQSSNDMDQSATKIIGGSLRNRN